MECERCGETFSYISVLKRHLKKKTPCDTSRSITSRDYLLEKLDSIKGEKTYACQCGKSYKYPTGLYQHGRNCNKYKSSRGSETKTLKKRVAELEKYIQNLETTSSPASQYTTNIARAQNVTNNTTNNTTNNSITNNNNFNLNIKPWNPSNFDYSRLDDDKYEQAFEADNQVETFAKFALNSPKNHVIIVSKDGIPMFFDGKSFIAVPDGIMQTYAAFFNQLKTYTVENEDKMRTIFNSDAFGLYDDHMERLVQAEDLKDHSMLVKVISKNTDKVLKSHAIEA